MTSWLKKGDIQPAKTLPFGRRTLNFFDPNIIDTVRQSKGLKARTEASRYDDFFEFIEKKDYTFSYKIVFMLSLLKHINEQGEAPIDDVTNDSQQFYLELFKQYERVEKAKNPLNELKISITQATYSEVYYKIHSRNSNENALCINAKT